MYGTPFELLYKLADAPSKVVWFDQSIPPQAWARFMEDCDNQVKLNWDDKHPATLYEVVACIIAVTLEMPFEEILLSDKVIYKNQKGFNMVSLGEEYIVLHYLSARDVPESVQSNVFYRTPRRISCIGAYGEIYKD